MNVKDFAVECDGDGMPLFDRTKTTSRVAFFSPVAILDLGSSAGTMNNLEYYRHSRNASCQLATCKLAACVTGMSVICRTGEPELVEKKRLLECSFLIPIRRDGHLSDGRLHRSRCWTWLEERLLAFGGATRDTALQQGWYPDPDMGQRVQDDSRRYVVALPAPPLANYACCCGKPVRCFNRSEST